MYWHFCIFSGSTSLYDEGTKQGDKFLMKDDNLYFINVFTAFLAKVIFTVLLISVKRWVLKIAIF